MTEAFKRDNETVEDAVRRILHDYLENGGPEKLDWCLDLCGDDWVVEAVEDARATNKARQHKPKPDLSRLEKKEASFVVPSTQLRVDSEAPEQPTAKEETEVEPALSEARRKELQAEIDEIEGIVREPEVEKPKPEQREEEPEKEREPKPKLDAVPDHILASITKPEKTETALIVRPSSEAMVMDWTAQLSDDQPEVYLAAMNERHAIIDDVGGKTVIAGWEVSTLDTSKLKIVFGTKESLLLRYSNYRVWSEVGNDWKKVALAPWWLGHSERRQYRGIVFRPGEPKVIDRCLNMWQGWGVEAKQGDWSLIRRHIEEVLANGNPEYAEYIIYWIAWSVQHPGEQAEVALVLIGKKGSGKGTLGRCLRRIFGAHAFQVTSREEVIGKFNGHLQDCILFIADEAYWGGDKRCVGRLQGMITEETIPIERKGIDMILVKNCLHIVMLAEPGWVIPAGKHERRYAASYVSQAMLGNKPYFKALHDQIDGEGTAAMLYDLQRLDLGDWHPRNIEKMKKSPALLDQQMKTLPPLEQWYFMILQDGVIPGAFSKRPNTAYTHALIDNAKERMARLRYELTEVMLRNFLTDQDSLGIEIKKFRSSAGNGWSFPPLDECRAAWDRNYNPIAWDSDIVEWKTKQKDSSELNGPVRS